MNRKIGVLSFLALSATTLAAPAAEWQKINDGRPLSHEGGVLHLGRPANGDLLFFVRDVRLGMIMGRIRQADRQWQYFSDGAWDAAAYPTAVSPILARYRDMQTVPLPGSDDGLMGVVSFPGAGLYYGEGGLDIHGNSGFMRFDGSAFTHWRRNAEFSPFFLARMVGGWGGSIGSFAFNPDSATGIFLTTSTGTSPPSRLRAARYQHADASRTWRHWGDSDNVWPGSGATTQNMMVTDNNIGGYGSPRIVHLGGGDYLAMVRYKGTDGEASMLTPLRYLEGAPPVWQWWNGSAWVTWESGQPVVHADLAPLASHTSTPWSLTLLPGRRAMLTFYHRTGITAGDPGHLYAYTYDDAAGTWAGPELLSTIANPEPASTRLADYDVAVDGASTVWLSWLDSGTQTIKVRKRPAGGEWSVAETIYSDATSLYGIGFLGVAADTPVCFVGEGESLHSTHRHRKTVYAVSPDPGAWAGETPLATPTLPADQPKNHAAFYLEQKVRHWSPDAGYGGGGGGPLAVDQDGTLYSPSPAYCSVIVRDRDDPDEATARAWGTFWDHFQFPAGVSVDNRRGKVYVPSHIIADGSGGVETRGRFSVIERDMRDRSFGFQNMGSITAKNRWYAPQVVGMNSFSWPADTAVDEERGRLYVANSSLCEVRIYDIESTEYRNTTAHPFPLSGPNGLKEGVGEADHARVDSIIGELVAAGHLAWETPDERLYWPVFDPPEPNTWPPIDDLVQASTHLAGMTTNNRNRFLRNLMGAFQQRHDLPVLLGTLGSEGDAPGQFRFPQGLTVDPDGNLYVADMINHRIQKFDADGAFLQAWGDFGIAEGALLYPFAIAADPTFNLVYVVDAVQRRVLVFDRAGEFLTSWTGAYRGVTADGEGRVFLVGIESGDSQSQFYTYRIVDHDLDANGDGIPDSLQPHLPKALHAHDAAVETEGNIPVEIFVVVDGDVPAFDCLVLDPPTQGTVTTNGGVLVYTPDPYTHGSDQFKFRARHADQVSNVATVTVTILPVNHPPVVWDTTVQVLPGRPSIIELPVHDPDGDPLDIAIVVPPSHGTLQPHETLPTHRYYMPGASYPGAGGDSFVFSASDGSLAEPVSATVTITTLPVLVTPTIEPDGGFFVGTVDVDIPPPPRDGGTVYYTTNGDEPTEASTLYEGPFVLSADATIRARGFEAGYHPSDIAVASFARVDHLPHRVRVETAPDGTGQTVASQTLLPNSPLTVYAVVRDEDGRFVGHFPADRWCLIEKDGEVSASDLVPAPDGKSAVFTGPNPGSARIRATFGTLLRTPSGRICVGTHSPGGIPVEWLHSHALPTDGSVEHEDLTGKGMTVFEDWVAGTDPNKSSSRFVFSDTEPSGTGGVILRWWGRAGRRYAVYRRTDLLAGGWGAPIDIQICEVDGAMSFSDNDAPSGRAYYRLTVEWAARSGAIHEPLAGDISVAQKEAVSVRGKWDTPFVVDGERG